MRISDWSSDVCSSDLLNVFASWCIPCIAESPQLMRLKAMGVPIEGVAVRDTPENTDIFLRRYGNPFVAVGDDRDGRLQLAIGSSGVPESYVIDGKGRSEERRVGKEGVGRCRSGWSP